MGFCIAVNCGNFFRKQKNGGVSFFRLPKDEKLKKKWLVNIRREKLPKEVTICLLHFEAFKRDLQLIHHSM